MIKRVAIPVSHIGGLFAVQGLEDVRAALLREAGEGMDFRADDHEVRRRVGICHRLPRFRQDHESR